jgi:hypothetical protein
MKRDRIRRAAQMVLAVQEVSEVSDDGREDLSWSRTYLSPLAAKAKVELQVGINRCYEDRDLHCATEPSQ